MGYIGNKPSAVPLTSADITDGIITSAKIADGTIVNADINASAGIVTSKLSGALGITEADQWRITAALTGTGAVITANWERADTNSPGIIGTGMTQSSGRFTFPSTGIYLVSFGSYVTATSTRDYAGAYIMVSTDGGSNFSVALEMFGSVNVNNAYDQLFGSLLLDVTNTTNIKVEFNIAASGSTLYDGATGNNRTYATFIRLGDT